MSREFDDCNSDELIIQVVAKKLLSKGIAFGAMMALQRLFPKVIQKMAEYSSLNGLLLYLKPSQVAVEIGAVAWDVIVLKYIAPRVGIEAGYFPSVVHASVFMDCLAHGHWPSKWRWVMSFVPITNEKYMEYIQRIDSREIKALTFMHVSRTLYQTVSTWLVARLQGYSHVQPQTAAVLLATDMTFHVAGYSYSFPIQKRFPKSWQTTPGWYGSSRSLALFLSFFSWGMGIGLVMPLLQKPLKALQGFQPVPPLYTEDEYLPLSAYHEFGTYNGVELVLFTQFLINVMNSVYFDNNMRVHAVKAYVHMNQYVHLVKLKRIKRTRTHPLSGTEQVISAVDAKSIACGSCDAQCKEGFALRTLYLR